MSPETPNVNPQCQQKQFCKKLQLRQEAYKYNGSFVDINSTIILCSSGPEVFQKCFMLFSH